MFHHKNVDGMMDEHKKNGFLLVSGGRSQPYLVI